jgi:phosphatidylserine/phosphatidylglycerophosphate/cardiolipin synthase-like enzyme
VLVGLNRWLGRQITTQVRSHHRRRLRAIGHEAALDAPAGGWADTTMPPRPGNAIRILIDGEQALPSILDELLGARSHVHITGWHFAPDFALVRNGKPGVLRNVLAELAERVEVRMLAWAGAPLPLFRPSREDMREVRRLFVEDSQIQFALDPHERPLHCHHEKTIVIDDRIAFVGGIDLTGEAGDRYDTNEHPSRASVGWHDACARVEGPAVADVAAHFAMRWHEVTGERVAPATPPEAAGDVEVQLVRTVPEKIYGATADGDFGILESYLRAFRAAQRLIYVENQFLWSPEIAMVLAEKLAHLPSPDFRILLVLPAQPNSGADDTRGVLSRLLEADDGAGRILACTLAARSPAGPDAIYVHAKIAIVDDAWLTIGSANLNEHSLFNDTEVNIVTHDAALARETRVRLWAEHLELPVEAVDRDPVSVIDELWRPIATEQRERYDDGQGLTHRLLLLKNISTRSSCLMGPLSGLLVDG